MTDGDFRSARPHLQRLREDGNRHEKHAEEEETDGDIQQAPLPQCFSQRLRQTQGGIDRYHDSQHPQPQAALSTGREESHGRLFSLLSSQQENIESGPYSSTP